MAVAYFMGHAPQGFWPVLNQGAPAILFCFIWLYFSAAARGRGAWMPSAGGKPLDRSIVEGPLARAVWMLAWPTMLQNLIAGSRAWWITPWWGTSWLRRQRRHRRRIQIFIVVIVFVISVFGGMGVLVARFAGANEPRR